MPKDGTAFWSEIHLSPVQDEHGRLTHYLGFQYDVTAHGMPRTGCTTCRPATT